MSAMMDLATVSGDLYRRTVSHYGDLARAEGRILAVPDVAAMDAVLGAPTAARVALAGRARVRSPAQLVDGLGGCLAMGAMAVGSATVILDDSSHLHALAVLAAFAAGCAACLGAARMRHLGLDLTPSRRRLAELSDLDARAARDARTGYLLSRDGITRLEVAGGLARRDVPASSLASVEVRDEGPDHVTVVPEGLLGRLEMPWLRRTGDLVEVGASWRKVTGTVNGGDAR